MCALKQMIDISEIFYSIQGESTLTGRKTLFFRFAKCNLKCKLCDTNYSFTAKCTMPVSELTDISKEHKAQYICITGGEPLIQKEALIILINELLKLQKTVSIETNGSLSIKEIPAKVKRVIDIKTPSSGFENSFKLENLEFITENDEIKFLIFNKKDFEYMERFIEVYNLEKIKCPILVSPNLKDTKLTLKVYDWMLESDKNLILQPQLHKLLNFP